MGVVYKLKEDVVHYIIDRKRKDSSLSCRKLVDLIQQRFKVVISKSSINNVIQSVDLSSPVGRPQGLKKPKKFTIPSAKKEQLLSAALKPKLGLKEQTKPRSKTKPSVKKQVKSLGKGTAYKLKDLSDKRPVKASAKSLSPGLVSSVMGPVDKGKYYDGMGCFFLKAAEWSLSDSSVLGHILHKYIPDSDLKELEAACEILLYLEPFGIKEPSDLAQYQQQGLWVLNGFKGILDYQSILKITEGVRDIKSFNIEMSNEIAQLIQEIKFMKITLVDSNEVLVDSQLTSVWPRNVQSNISFPMQKTLDIMSKLIINNLDPMVFCSIPGAQNFSPEFFDMVSAFENLQNKTMTKITLLDDDDYEIAEFTTIPNQKRFFIIGAWPWQREFARLKEESEGLPVHSFYNKKLNKIIYYTEAYTNFLNDHINDPLPALRAYLIRETVEEAPILAVLANSSVVEMSAEKVISAYLLRWPNLQRGNNIYYVRSEGLVDQKLEGPPVMPGTDAFEAKLTSSLRSNFRNFLSILDNYCKKHFFPFHYSDKDLKSITSICYGLPGFLKEYDDAIIVRLVMPRRNYPYKEDLGHAIKRVNESDIRDHRGRKLLLALDSSKAG